MLYLSYQAPHNPLQAPNVDIMKHRGNYLNGWQAVRESRFRRQKETGVVPADSKLPDYPRNLPNRKALSPEQSPGGQAPSSNRDASSPLMDTVATMDIPVDVVLTAEDAWTIFAQGEEAVERPPLPSPTIASDG